jgi:hypothetical protein
MQITETTVANILTRTSGFLQTVCSHSLRTRLPIAMAAVEPASITLEYREQMVAIAKRYLPGRVGVNIEGGAGRML